MLCRSLDSGVVELGQARRDAIRGRPRGTLKARLVCAMSSSEEVRASRHLALPMDRLDRLVEGYRDEHAKDDRTEFHQQIHASHGAVSEGGRAWRGAPWIYDSGTRAPSGACHRSPNGQTLTRLACARDVVIGRQTNAEAGVLLCVAQKFN